MNQQVEQRENHIGYSRFFLVIGAVLGALAVIIGAFGAHALKPILSDYGQGIWNTAVLYQMFHALAIVAVGILLLLLNSRKLLLLAGFSFLIGSILFSGSLYTIALVSIGRLGLVTPIGGLFFIVGWLLLVSAAMASTRIRTL